MAAIDRTSPIPLYFQLKQILLQKIERAEWKPGEMIPSEQELQDHYNVSRTTVRQTLGELVFEGHLVRQRGRGTFIADPQQKLTHNPDRHLSLSEYMLRQGIKPGWRVYSQEWETPSPEIQEMLNLREDEKVYRILRLRLADDEVIGYHIAYLPPSVARRINHDALAEGESLRYLLHLPDMQNSRARRTIEAAPATPDDIDLIGIDAGCAILLIERLITSADDTPIELMQARYRGDRFKYQITGSI